MARFARLAALTSLALVIAGAGHALAGSAECDNVRMPQRFDAAGVPLVLNGMGIRQATIFNVDVYVAGLYLTAPSRDGEAVLREMKPMIIVLQLVRDVKRDEMNDAIRKGFERNAGSRMAALEPRMLQFERLIPNLKNGDSIAFGYRPGSSGVLQINVNGRPVGTVTGVDFARTFFAIWLGDHPPNAGLKRGLLGGGC